MLVVGLLQAASTAAGETAGLHVHLKLTLEIDMLLTAAFDTHHHSVPSRELLAVAVQAQTYDVPHSQLNTSVTCQSAEPPEPDAE